MDSEGIEGCTHCIGEAQGFIPLEIRDEVQDCGPNFGNVPVMVTQWRPTPAEVKALVSGAPVFLSLWGTSWPPAMLTVGMPPYPHEIEGNG